MPDVFDHFEKSLIRLVRQSTTVPNTSNTSAFTAETSDMVGSPIVFLFLSLRGDAKHRTRKLEIPGLALARHPGMTPYSSIQVEFLQLAMLCLDVPHRPRDRAHHDGFGLDDVLAELDACQQRARGDAGCGKQTVALHHVLDAVDHLRIGHA